jgi:peptide/nickel transport system permease protein
VLQLIARRLALSVPLLFVASALSFVLVSLTPGDAASSILGANATPERLEQLREQLGLDRSLPEQYAGWLSGAVRGDMGTSLTSGEAVVDSLTARLPVTAALICGALVVAGALGIALGLVSARRGGRLGRAVDLASLVGLALPTFWFGLVLVSAFAVATPLFPATGYVALAEGPVQWARSLVLPVVTLSVGAVAFVAKQTRDSMLDVGDREFVRALRARGVPERAVLRHALRNACIPVVTVLGLMVIGLLSGTVLAESVFALPGLGSLVVQATAQNDVPLVQGIVVSFTAIVIVVNLLVDVSYGVLNPKVRTS